MLVEELARGGMGTVWLAEDPKLRRPVAIKLLFADFANNDSSRRRFEREAMAVAQLQCPQVVQIFDYGVEGSLPYIVMERLVGEDLRHRLKKERILALDEAAHIVWQVAKALAAAHSAGIIHRDLKPANVFLVPQGEEEIAKVLDFGVAKTGDAVEPERMPRALVGTPLKKIDVSDEMTKAGTILGTPHFMSPEQARGNTKLDHRSDLWSLGVIAYRMITGKLPFRGKEVSEIIVKVVTEMPAPPTTIAPDLFPAVDKFFERALAKSPDDRFASAKEMAKALRTISNAPLPTISLPDPRAPLSSDLSFDASGRFTPYGAEGSDPRSASGSDPLGAMTPAPASMRDPLPSSAFAAPPSSRTRPAHAGAWTGSPSDRGDDEHTAPSEVALNESTLESAAPGAPDEAKESSRTGRWIALGALLLVGVGVWAFVELQQAPGADPTGAAQAAHKPQAEPPPAPETSNDPAEAAPSDGEPGDPEPSASATATVSATAESETEPPPPRPVPVYRPRPRPAPVAAPQPPPQPQPPSSTVDPFAERH